MNTDERRKIEEQIDDIGLSIQALEEEENGQPMEKESDERSIVWTVAGSDSGGGAGIQADLKTFQAFGVHGCSVVTALTAQTPRAVEAVECVSPEMVLGQWDALLKDLPPLAIKIGMPGSTETIKALYERLTELDAYKVIDPVMVSTSGHDLMGSEALEAFRTYVLPFADLLTPNLAEASILLDRKIATPEDMEAAAHELLNLGPSAVFMKGGHLDNQWCPDYWTNGVQHAWLVTPTLDSEFTHGTGCTTAAALAAAHALGYHALDAAVLAKTYVTQAIARAYPHRRTGSLNHAGWPTDSACLPFVAQNWTLEDEQPVFPVESTPIGPYPIVQTAEWVEQLLSLGITTIQLRIKDPEGIDVDGEVQRAVAAGKAVPGARVYINDHWEAALKHGAYGVHLGQDDLESADLEALENAGMRLGLSTHSYSEIARAVRFNPSYIAIGTLFHTDSKVMDYAPLGLEHFRRLCKLSPVPVVAIGGIKLDNAADALRAGADGVAMISAFTESDDLPGDAARWLSLFQ